MPWCEGMPRAGVAVGRAGGVLRQACQPLGGPVRWSRGVFWRIGSAVLAEVFFGFLGRVGYIAFVTKRMLIRPLSRFINLFRAAFLLLVGLVHPLAGTPDLLTSIGHRGTVWGLFEQISARSSTRSRLAEGVGRPGRWR